MPQGKKTPPEKIRFKRMLQNINLLYLGSSVLILQELSYMSRFWRARPPPSSRPHNSISCALAPNLGPSPCSRRTQFEAWCSMQEASEEGLRPAPAARRRCTVVPILQATDIMAAELVRMWAG